MPPPDRASEQALLQSVAIVVAAGSGERLGAGRPKAFVPVGGRPMAAWSLDAIAVAGIPRAVVAVPPGQAAAAEEALHRAFPLGLAFVEGGATRSASVRNALMAAGPDAEAVVVHDAARPMVTPGVFTQTLAALADADAAVAAARVTDTIKEAGAGRSAS
jgi:2-C-methyl-D-erythritol 4-phosphate cytidylyltransferase